MEESELVWDVGGWGVGGVFYFLFPGLHHVR